VQKILGHHNISTTIRYTQLTTRTDSNANQLINNLMNGFSIQWGNVK